MTQVESLVIRILLGVGVDLQVVLALRRVRRFDVRLAVTGRSVQALHRLLHLLDVLLLRRLGRRTDRVFRLGVLLLALVRKVLGRASERFLEQSGHRVFRLLLRDGYSRLVFGLTGRRRRRRVHLRLVSALALLWLRDALHRVLVDGIVDLDAEAGDELAVLLLLLRRFRRRLNAATDASSTGGAAVVADAGHHRRRRGDHRRGWWWRRWYRRRGGHRRHGRGRCRRVAAAAVGRRHFGNGTEQSVPSWCR